MNTLSKLIIFLCLVPVMGRGQINLVLNPSFEQYSHCQPRMSNIKYANYWTPIQDTFFTSTDTLGPGDCTPEYCNTCVPFYTQVSVPLSVWYYHYPRTGNGMVHLNTYYKDAFDTTTYARREYLQGRLKSRLITGNLYNVFFYISFTQTSAYANNNIGAYLDDATIDTTTQCGMPQITHHPQINDTTIYTDTLHWKKIEGTFIANGTESFITIGNFFDGAHTDTVYVNYWNFPGTIQGRYLVDDVGVINCNNVPHAGSDTTIHQGDSAYLGTHEQLLPYTWYAMGSSTAIDSGSGVMVRPSTTTTYVLEQKLCGVTKYDTVKVTVIPSSVMNYELLMVNVRVYPNPATNELTITGAEGCVLSISDITGRLVLQNSATTQRHTLDISSLGKGVYFVRITDTVTGESITKRLLKE